MKIARPPQSKTAEYQPAIEALEARVAPAAINPLTVVPNPGDLKITDPKTAYFHDADGDFFIITTTKGAFSDGTGALPATFTVDANHIIEEIDLSAADFNTVVKGVTVGTFQGAAITVKVIAPTKANGLPTTGDGRLNVGYVNATGVDLAGVTIPGDLTRIDAGDTNDKTTGLSLLSLQSMGTLGLTTQANLAGTNAAKLTSNIHGHLGTLRVIAAGKSITHQTIQDAFIDVTSPDADPKTGVDPKYGSIGAIEIDGLSVTNTYATVKSGATPTYAPGTIRASGAISSATVYYSIAGGTEDYSGEIWSRVSIGAVNMSGKILANNPPDGTLVGGTGFASGTIVAGNLDTGATVGKLGAVKISKVGTTLHSGDVVGGGGIKSGTIYGETGITSVYIGGNLDGGTNSYSGAVISGIGVLGTTTGLIGATTIRGGIFGTSADASGIIESAGGITSVTVYGSEVGGTGHYSGSIVALGGNVTTITIKGELDSDPGATADETGIFVDGVLSTLSIAKVNSTHGSASTTANVAVVARGPMDKNGNLLVGNAFNTITIGSLVNGVGNGVANHLDIVAGFDHVFDSQNTGSGLNNPDASIGTVTVNGNLFATTITAGTNWGANNIPGPDIPIGVNPTTDDTPLPFGQAVATIAKIVVTGLVTGGDPNHGNETVFEAAKLSSVTIGTTVAPAFPGVALKEIQLFDHAYLLQVTG